MAGLFFLVSPVFTFGVVLCIVFTVLICFSVPEDLGVILYLRCNCSVLSWSSSLRCINLTVLFNMVCIFLFWVYEAMHIGMDGYSMTGISNVLTRVVFIFCVWLVFFCVCLIRLNCIIKKKRVFKNKTQKINTTLVKTLLTPVMEYPSIPICMASNTPKK